MTKYLVKLLFYSLTLTFTSSHIGYVTEIPTSEEKLLSTSAGQTITDDLLDRMERGELAVIETPSMTLREASMIPVDFVRTLADPLTVLIRDAARTVAAPFMDDGQGHKLSLVEEGKDATGFQYGTTEKAKEIAGKLKDKIINAGQVVKENPLDALGAGVAVAVGYTGVAEIAPVTTSLVATTVSAVRNSKMVYTLAQSIEGDRLFHKAARIGLYAVGVYALASVPAAAASSYHQWNSLADAQAYYSSSSCYADERYGQDWQTLMRPVAQCVRDGGSLEQCQVKIPSSHPGYDMGKDLYAFTRHASANPDLDPVSIVQLDDKRTCFLTALDPRSPVTKTCFDSLSNLDSRTVEALPDLKLIRAHEGLEAGQSVRHVGLHLSDSGTHKASCGHFSQAGAKYELGEKPVCLLTALTPGGAVTQMCFDPSNPETLTIKPVEGISLDFKDNGGNPVSIIIKDPRKLGLDVKPEVLPSSKPTPAPAVQEGTKICEEGKCYEMRKVEVPCEGKQEL